MPFSIKKTLKDLRREAYTLYLELRDPRTPWYAKLLILFLLVYILSPIDIIPDPIPVIGVMDDMAVVSAGIWLLLRIIPIQIHNECEKRAVTEAEEVAKNWIVRTVFILIMVLSWIGAIYITVKLIYH